ncbi:MAG: biopolymer transporter ExbD [Pseudomonadota bacterium]
MNTLEQQEEREEINLTPMLDVVFILLIFFVVLASFTKDFGVPVGLPAGTTEHGDIETITVTVEAGRTFNVNGRALAGGSLAPYVRRLSAEFPDAGFAVLVADESRVADTVRAVDAGRRAGFAFVPVSSVP